MNIKKVIVGTLLACGTFGCQSMPYQPYARDVKRKPQQGGVIALKTEHRDEDRAKAQNIMTSNCGAGYFKILEEGEVVVGEKTSARSDQTYNRGTSPGQVGSLFGVPVMAGQDPSTQANAESSTTQLREWQISYECATADLASPKPLKKAENPNGSVKSKKIVN
jgi:hypothetical protein